ISGIARIIIFAPLPGGDREMRFRKTGSDAHRFRSPPRDRPHVGVGKAIDLEHLFAGGIDLIDAPRQLETEQARTLAQPGTMLGKLEDLAVIGALSFEDRRRIMQRVSEHVHPGVTPRDQFAIKPDPAVAVVERALLLLSHFSLCYDCMTRLGQARLSRKRASELARLDPGVGCRLPRLLCQ